MTIKTSWDITKGMPSPQAWFSNSKGSVANKGSYVTWPVGTGGAISTDKIKCCVPGGMLAAQDCYIAKVFRPYVREATFDYDKMKESPVDLNDKKNFRRCARKISRILHSLGVAYIDRAGLIYTTNDVKVSGWSTNMQGKEGIGINPWVLLQTNMSKLLVLTKKEVLHRALFKQYKHLTNKKILNFTLDVLAMRIAATSPYDKLDKSAIRLGENLFNPKMYKKFPLFALCDPSLTAKQVKNHLPHEIASIWLELYETTTTGILPPLSKIKPSSLYFRIKSLVDDGASVDAEDVNYPWNIMPSALLGTEGNCYNDEQVPAEDDKKGQNLNKSVANSFKPKRYQRMPGYNNAVTDFLGLEVFKKKSVADDALKELTKKLRTQRLLDDMEAKLTEILGKESSYIKPYPEYLSVLGQMLVALKFSDPDVIPLYWNADDDRMNKKKKVAVFLDLSPSMSKFFPYMGTLVSTLEDKCDLALVRNDENGKGGTSRGIYSFAGKVTELSSEDLDNLKEGKFKPGASTRFDDVMDKIIDTVNENNVDIILIFTDGEGDISNKEKLDKFNQSNKMAYRIYMSEHYGDARDVTKVKSPFDKLKGESYTLNLPAAYRH